jgi:Ca2+-binding RTX toxin-like protein
MFSNMRPASAARTRAGGGRQGARAAVAAAALALAGTQALPASAATTAFAEVGTCKVVGSELRYTANAGIDNDVVIGVGGGNIIVDDGAGEVGVGAGCNNAGGNATVRAAIITRIRVTVLDGDDTVRALASRPTAINGGAGADELNGGPGTDSCNGGAGTDTEVKCE